ncbi:MAG: hypothetical protein IKY17_02895, partial [Oscillospiraceae bacterium]|nr:hypothetical protein [Oscillospiraceae bacterium]
PGHDVRDPDGIVVHVRRVHAGSQTERRVRGGTEDVPVLLAKGSTLGLFHSNRTYEMKTEILH